MGDGNDYQLIGCWLTYTGAWLHKELLAELIIDMIDGD